MSRFNYCADIIFERFSDGAEIKRKYLIEAESLENAMGKAQNIITDAITIFSGIRAMAFVSIKLSIFDRIVE